MSGRINYKSMFAGIGCALLFSVAGASADVFIGMDEDADLECSTDEMIKNSATAMNDQQIDIFFEGDNLYSANCTFCIEDAATISLDTVIATVPGAWTITDLQNSEDTPGMSVADWIKTAYPSYKCWLFQSTDFSFGSPIGPGAVKIAEVHYDILTSGRLGFHIDGANSGWFTTAFVSGSCAEPPGSATCKCFTGTGATSSEESSWSAVKQIFR